MSPGLSPALERRARVYSMPADLFIAIDCSTTGVKCIVWDASGSAVSTARASLGLTVPMPGAGEQDPAEWWSATCEAVERATHGIDPARFGSLCVANQRETFACLDADGVAVRPAMLWLDSRAGAEVEEFGSLAIHETTGKPPNTTPAFYKLLWLQKHEPENMAKTRHIVDVHGYVTQRMTGLWSTSLASADPLGLVDLASGTYDAGLLSIAGITVDQLSELVSPGDALGALTADAATQLGLTAGLAVIAGAGDGQAAALGADISRPRVAYINIGTGLVSGCYSESYRADRAYRVLTGPIPGTFSYELFVSGGTYLVNWFSETFVDKSVRDTLQDGELELMLGNEAALVAPGSDGLLVLPYWNGALTPYWDHLARGMIFGITGIHTRGHIYRALLEGLCFELRVCLGRAEEVTGQRIDTFVAMGGGSKSALWCQMMADILGRPITVSAESETTCLGAGMLAAAGVGHFSSIRDASESMSSLGFTYSPDATLTPVYDERFEQYRQLYPLTRSLLPAIQSEAVHA